MFSNLLLNMRFRYIRINTEIKIVEILILTEYSLNIKPIIKVPIKIKVIF